MGDSISQVDTITNGSTPGLAFFVAYTTDTLPPASDSASTDGAYVNLTLMICEF